ncbi:hypothetical protein AMR41_24170 [Hapalosiphon sp. MRB220]|nr:hypothetical protein AMR41_24170 [Hapalosiphon sp. MRB220]
MWVRGEKKKKRGGLNGISRRPTDQSIGIKPNEANQRNGQAFKDSATSQLGNSTIQRSLPVSPAKCEPLFFPSQMQVMAMSGNQSFLT